MTPNFSLSELTKTNTGLKNDPSEEDKVRLLRLAKTMERVRAACENHPVIINSAFRSMAVNKAVGGSRASAHLRGDAADFVVKGVSAKQTCKIIRESAIEFDQLIEEYHNGAEWVHLGLSDNPRNEYLIYKNGKYTRVE